MFLSLLIITAGVAGAAYISKTAPKARKRKPVKIIPMVRVIELNQDAHRVVIQAMGTVIPAREITLESRVSGEVVKTHPEFIEGGFTKKGTVLLQLDPQDYQLAIEQKRSAIADARYALKLEQGHQDVAKREWELLNAERNADERDIELALRKPHLAKAKADLAAAFAELKQAKLDLERTKIRAPFNAIIQMRHVDVGSQVSTQDQLAQLVGTDEYWIQASVPVDRLDWIRIPRNNGERGARVRVIYRNTHERTGTVIKLLADLEKEGRMARLLIEVKDPLGMKETDKKTPPLLIGEYVRLEIEGRQLQDVFRIPRSAMRDNTKVWIASPENKLEVREVDTLWRDAQTVLLREGIRSGERLIVSDLPTPVNGMEVQVLE